MTPKEECEVLLLHYKNPLCIFPIPFDEKIGQSKFAENHTTNTVLLLSFLFSVALQKVLTAYYVLIALQSLRHGFAVPPPFAQGRLWCGT